MTEQRNNYLTIPSNNPPVFGRLSGQMREREGYCTVSYGMPTICPKCKKNALYLHQKEKHNATYVCYDCYKK